MSGKVVVASVARAEKVDSGVFYAGRIIKGRHDAVSGCLLALVLWVDAEDVVQESVLYAPEDDCMQNENVRETLSGLPEYARDILMLRFDLELSFPVLV